MRRSGTWRQPLSWTLHWRLGIFPPVVVAHRLRGLARLAFGVALFGQFLLVEGRGWAAVPTRVEELIRQGVALRRSGQDQAALPLFQKAHEIGHTPRTAAQLGLVEMALGYVLEAERDL